MTFSGIFTHNKYYTQVLENLLKDNNLLNYFKEFNLDYNEEIKTDYHTIIRKKFSFDGYMYYKTIENADMTYIREPEYQQFLKRKMSIINSYRIQNNKHKLNLFIARKMLNNPAICPAVIFEGIKEISDESAKAWIKRKAQIKEEHLKLMREEYRGIKHWIREYREKRQSFLTPQTAQTTG